MPLEPERPPHVKLVKGRWYWDPPDRLRHSGQAKTVSLGAEQSAAWDYARRLNAQHLELRDSDPVPGTVAWLFRQFEESDRYVALSAGTQRDYRWLGRVLEAAPVATTTLGKLPAIAIKARHADGLFRDLLERKGHHTAHYACRYARRVWHWGARREHVGHVNPWSGMELPSLPARRARWTPEQVAAVVAAAQERGRPSLALATMLAYWLGHRQGDVLDMTWPELAAGLRQSSKTGVILPLAPHAYPELAAALEAAPQPDPDDPKAPQQVVIHENTGERYNRYTFNRQWREVATAAGIPAALQFRDLRATAATELADAGASALDMSTHHGWDDPKMARRYARRTVEQAEAAAAKRLGARKSAGKRT